MSKCRRRRRLIAPHELLARLIDAEGLGCVDPERLEHLRGEHLAHCSLEGEPSVTPRFRDLAPGKYVFRTSNLLRDKGFRRVLTPPGMVKPYYAGLGFTPVGEQWELTLS